MNTTGDDLPVRMNAEVNHGRGAFRYEELQVPQLDQKEFSFES